MASTTKIMTCILALENGDLSDTVTVSVRMQPSQPQVKLGMKRRAEYSILKDLLYSLMLESHNDSAVAIAEHIARQCGRFCRTYEPEGRRASGCLHTYFITPNGLDAQDENGTHHTTAEDLARIMKYCIMDSEESSEFLEITRTPEYSFTDSGKGRSFQCTNHNAFLNMMEGALSGKTGFTADAGYCYVGALRKDDRTFIVALLACGWPNAKGYKWADTRKLMTYGLENYFYRDSGDPKQTTRQISVKNAVSDGYPGDTAKTLTLLPAGQLPSVLMKEGEEITEEWEIPGVRRSTCERRRDPGERALQTGRHPSDGVPCGCRMRCGRKDISGMCKVAEGPFFPWNMSKC